MFILLSLSSLGYDIVFMINANDMLRALPLMDIESSNIICSYMPEIWDAWYHLQISQGHENGWIFSRKSFQCSTVLIAMSFITKCWFKIIK